MKRRERLVGFVAHAFILLAAAGCVYRLPSHNMPSTQKLRIVSNVQRRWRVQVNADKMFEYPVADDGRVSFDVPRLPRADDVYFLDVIKVRSGTHPCCAKAITVVENSHIVKKLSLMDISQLPLDVDG